MLDIPLCFRIIIGVGTVNTTLYVLFIAIYTTHITQMYLYYLLQQIVHSLHITQLCSIYCCKYYKRS